MFHKYIIIVAVLLIVLILVQCDTVLMQAFSSACLFKFIERNVEERALITVLTERRHYHAIAPTLTSILEMINQAGRWTMQIMRFSNFRPVSTNRHPTHIWGFYMIFVDDLSSLLNCLKNIRQIDDSNRLSAKYLIFYSTAETHYKNRVKEIMNIMYDNNYYKTSVLIQIDNNASYLFGLDLYANRVKYCGSNPKIVLLNKCLQGIYADDRFKTHNDAPTKLNCTIKTVAMAFPPFVIDEHKGLEILILHEIASKLNVSFEIKLHKIAKDWGQKVNNSWMGALQGIYNRKYQAGIGGVALQEERLEDFDLSDNYFNDRLVWIIPAALELPHWKYIFVVFSLTTWLALLGIFIISTGTFYFFGRRYREFAPTFSGGFLMTLQIFIGLSVPRQPTHKPLRLIYVSLALFTIIIVCLYQSSLIDIITTPIYEKQIETEDEIFSSGLTIGGISAYRNIFYDLNDPHSMKIYNSFETYSHPNDTMYLWLETVAKDRDTITILQEKYVKYWMARKNSDIINKDDTAKIFIAQKYLYTIPVRIVFAKGYYLTNAINSIILKLAPSGLIQKWANEYLDGWDDFEEDEEDEYEDDHKEVDLTLEHLEGAFVLLLSGYILGLIAFIIECLTYKMSNKMHN